MEPTAILGIVGGLCCCLAVALALAGGAVWVLKRNKDGGEDPSSGGALESGSELDAADVAVGPQVTQPTPDPTPPSTPEPEWTSEPEPELDTPPPTPDPTPEPAGTSGPEADTPPPIPARDPEGASEPEVEAPPPPPLAEDDDTDPPTPVDDLLHAVIEEETDMKVVRQSGDAYLMEDPEDETRLWMWRPRDGGAEVPPAQWQDDWGPVPPGDVAVFCDHWVDQQDAEGMRTDTLDEALAALGYPDVGAWHRVYWTAVKHFGQPTAPGCLLEEYDISDLTTNHAVPARIRQQQRKAQQNAADDNELLAPFEGVTVESYASCAAAAAQGMSPEAFHAVLADHGMDPVKWERANAEWTDRMSKDASMTIVQFYGNAFQAAARGDFGSAGAAATDARTGTGGGADGEAPVSFERLSEIQGAMNAWSTSGQDVNGMLKEVFGLTALDWSNINTWWLSRLTTDMEKMQEHARLTEEAEARYKEAAGIPVGDPDADIQF